MDSKETATDYGIISGGAIVAVMCVAGIVGAISGGASVLVLQNSVQKEKVCFSACTRWTTAIQ